MQGTGSIRLGRIGPIPLYAHWTSLLLVWLAMDISGGRFEPFAAMLIALVSAIVLHECGHGLTALLFRARDVTITLWAFGGVCSSRRDGDRPWAELAILVAGPAVSYLLAGLALLGFLLIPGAHPVPLEDFGSEPFWMGLLTIVLWLNLILGIFNSMPLFPLDGGQILFQLQRGLGVPLPIACKISAGVGLVTAAGLLWWVNHDGLNLFSTLLIAFLVFITWNALMRPQATGDDTPER